MDDDVAVTFPEKAGGLHASQVIVCIHAGDVLILALNPHNRDLAGGKLGRWDRIAENDHSLNIVSEKLFDISALCVRESGLLK